MKQGKGCRMSCDVVKRCKGWIMRLVMFVQELQTQVPSTVPCTVITHEICISEVSDLIPGADQPDWVFSWFNPVY